MTSVWVVRADFGKYTEHFVKGGYVAVGWIRSENLSSIKEREDIERLYRLAYPEHTSKYVIGQQVGQIARFLLQIKAGDYVITPAADTELLRYCEVGTDPSYFYSSDNDGCPFLHRRRVSWAQKSLMRSAFSIPFQNAIRSSLTVFNVVHTEEFLITIGAEDSGLKLQPTTHDPYRVVLNQILELDAAEFEILVRDLLKALGFEGSEVTGKTGDGGVDVKGELNVSNLAKVKLFVQAKRYGVGAKVSANVVKQLRSAIPNDGQGAFITTADYQAKATDVAFEAGFPRIGLINGHQLVDLLVEHWESIPEEFRERLRLKPGLVLA